MTKAQEKATTFLKEFQELLTKHKVTIDLECDYSHSDVVSASIYSEGYYIAEDDHYTGFDISLKVVGNEITSKTEFAVKFEG